MKKVSILGAGAWGMALSGLLTDNGHQVTLWEPDSKRAALLHKDREDPARLPGVVIPYEVEIVSKLEKGVESKDLIGLAAPSHFMREVAKKLASSGLGDAILLNFSKGLENQTLCRMSEILTQELPQKNHSNICTLSGPSFAVEVSRKISTSVVIAGKDESIARQAQSILMNQYFRVYTSPDIIGVELGGALKNVIAIASGICDGMGMGDNTRGALITRGLAEMTRLGEKMGAQARTLSGLSGMGDLIATCTSKHSRNRHVGEEIAKGKKLEQILSEMVMVAEGVKTTQSAFQLASKFSVEMPITEQVYKILYEGKNPQEALRDLMTRQPKAEVWN